MSPLRSNSTFFLYSPTILLKKLSSYQLLFLSSTSQVNQNQTRQKITNYTSSWNSKLDEILISVVQFHLVHFCVQVPTWWWSKYSFGLIDTTGLCIGFIDRGALFWIVPVNLFVVFATHKFTLNILECIWVGLSSNRSPVSDTIDCRHCRQLFLQWRLNGIFKWVHQAFYIIGKMFPMLSVKYMLTYYIKEVIKGKIFWILN